MKTATITAEIDVPKVRATENRKQLLTDYVEAKKAQKLLKERIDGLQSEIFELLDEVDSDNIMIGSTFVRRAPVHVKEHVRPACDYMKLTVR